MIYIGYCSALVVVHSLQHHLLRQYLLVVDLLFNFLNT
nr:MAG TPA: hypothetical protein [Bacteriophage sp.]DAI57735.1 MAG TPA: hypothetical protein [Caudoviricetes sp.]